MPQGWLQRFKVDVHWDVQRSLQAMAEDVRQGLTTTPKWLPPKYFYDQKGSLLFERITELPEYYLTRTEGRILALIARGVMAEVRPHELVELGSGSSRKTRLLLSELRDSHQPVRYIPLDVDANMVESASASLLEAFPFLHVHGVVGTFEHHLKELPTPFGRRLVLFLGSTIGNLDPPARNDLLIEIRRLLEPDCRLLLGVCLVKDVSIMEAAYNDSAGVTAEFNRNILQVVNRNLHANFDLDAFQHQAIYNRQAGRIEMHLRPQLPQVVHVKDLDLTVKVLPDETIWTESSYKFTHESTATMLREAGLHLEGWYADADNLFGLALAAPG